MKAPRSLPPRLNLEHLLLLGVLSVFTAGAIWVGTSSRPNGPKQPAAWASLLPKIGLPMLNGLMPR